MKPSSKKIVETVAELLNRHLANQTPFGKLVSAGGEPAAAVMELVNEVLGEVAEGGRLAVATETSGELLGFVPRASVPIPDRPRPARQLSPEDAE